MPGLYVLWRRAYIHHPVPEPAVTPAQAA